MQHRSCLHHHGNGPAHELAFSGPTSKHLGHPLFPPIIQELGLAHQGMTHHPSANPKQGHSALQQRHSALHRTPFHAGLANLLAIRAFDMALAGCLALPGGGRDNRIGIFEATLVDCLAPAAGGRTIGVGVWDVSLADCLALAGPAGGIGAGRARGTAEVGALFLLLGWLALAKTLALF